MYTFQLGSGVALDRTCEAVGLKMGIPARFQEGRWKKRYFLARRIARLRRQEKLRRLLRLLGRASRVRR